MDKWHQVATLEEIPLLGTRVVALEQGNIALFRTGEGEVFALHDKCPHKGGPLSQGIIHGKKVACPLHNWNINLEDGKAVAPDEGCARVVPCKIENGGVLLRMA
jgi:nitrite reductase (NADH) small subunit